MLGRGRPIRAAEPLLHIGSLLVPLDRALMGGQLSVFRHLAPPRALVGAAGSSRPRPRLVASPFMAASAAVSKPANRLAPIT
jgi:hypothetical protein